MTDEQIQQWAKQAGVGYTNRHYPGNAYYGFSIEQLKAFAKLVQDAAMVQGEPEVHDAKCPALSGGRCRCSRNPIYIDMAWSQFCGGIGRGPDAPYPWMIEAFENHYGQSFTDKDWRTETGIWAAAWSIATNLAPPAQTPPPRLTDEQIERSYRVAGGGVQGLHAIEL